MLIALLVLMPQPQIKHDRTSVAIFVLAECPIARKYAPELQRMSNDYAGRARFYLVHEDATTTTDKAKAHSKEFKLETWAVTLDPERKLAKAAGVTTVPTAVVYDKSGKIRYHGRIDDRFPTLGYQRDKPTRQDLRIALNEVLAGKPVSIPRTEVVGCVLTGK